MAYLTADDFFTAIVGQAVDFDTGRGLVKLRGLNVSEVKQMQAKAGEVVGVDTLPLLVAFGLVEPRLTEDEVSRLAGGSFDLINSMAQRVMELTGIADTPKRREALDS